MLDQPVREKLSDMGGRRSEGRYAIDDIHGEVKTIEAVEHHHVERRGRRSFLHIAVHMEVLVIGSLIRQPMNELRIAVKRENHGLVRGEEPIEG
jgi:hypothetical protein